MSLYEHTGKLRANKRRATRTSMRFKWLFGKAQQQTHSLFSTGNRTSFKQLILEFEGTFLEKLFFDVDLIIKNSKKLTVSHFILFYIMNPINFIYWYEAEVRVKAWFTHTKLIAWVLKFRLLIFHKGLVSSTCQHHDCKMYVIVLESWK